MHPQAMQAVHRMVGEAVANGWNGRAQSGLDIGGQDVNGSARTHVPVKEWETLDLYDPTADYVADARAWCCIEEHSEVPFDVVLCCEVLEHVRWWPLVVRTCWEACWEGGLIIITCAAPGRPEHGAQGGKREPGEWYENIEPSEFHALISEVFQPTQWRMDVRTAPDDLYFWGIK
jgi:hypothetical protein